MNLHVDIGLKQGNFTLEAAFQCMDSALGVFGASGCGKSTLFRAIAGLAKPERGCIALGEDVLFDADQHVFVPAHKRGIGLVFQDARLFPHWGVEQNLRAGESIKERVADRAYSFSDIVDLLNIGHLVDRSVADLSGGEKQRIAIGRTLLSHPRLLLMDEPVTGLDISLKMQILPFLSKVHQTLRIPIILISHDLGEILQLTNRLLLLRDGRVIGYDTLDGLADMPDTLRELKGADLTNLVRATVRKHHPARGITELQSLEDPDTTIAMELVQERAPGTEVNFGIAANQIALALSHCDAISMRNQLPGRVLKIVHAPDRSICHVETRIGVLLSEITPGTEKDLGLKEGEFIWVIFKSLAIRQL